MVNHNWVLVYYSRGTFSVLFYESAEPGIIICWRWYDA